MASPLTVTCTGCGNTAYHGIPAGGNSEHPHLPSLCQFCGRSFDLLNAEVTVKLARWETIDEMSTRPSLREWRAKQRAERSASVKQPVPVPIAA